MEYKGEGIEALVALIEKMKKDSLIYADDKIKSMLKLLAYYDEFKNVLAVVVKNYKYTEEKEKHLILFNGKDYFKLPNEDKEIVAFVFNLILEFDNGNEELIAFAKKFYPAESIQASVNIFIKEVIEPFKKSISTLAFNGVGEEKVANIDTGRQVNFASNGIYEQTEGIIVSMVNEITTANISEQERSDCVLMLEGLGNALDSRDILMIRAIWCGLKKELTRLNLCKVQIVKIEDQMKLFLVIQ